MRKSSLVLAIAALAAPASLLAHPVNVPYASRGECERAFAESNKLDRERLVDVLEVFDTYGEAQRTFRDRFKCEYDTVRAAWYIVDYMPMP